MPASLLDPIKLGAIDAPNRIIMAPLTRGRAGPGFVPNELAVEYYRQRASAGLIISEATGISQEGLGWPSAPGLWTDAQVEGWKPVTEAVHAAGGRIVAQLWHMGRLVHSVFNDGKQPVSASATKGEGRAHTPVGRLELEEARPLRLDEIPRVIADYVAAAENAKRAGFDGVQLHGANGYLIDQFLRDGTNLRDDDYGGPVENRIRLLREVTEALIGVWGKDRVAVRLSPNGETQGVDDSAPEILFPAAAAALDALGIAFLELREPGPDGTFWRRPKPIWRAALPMRSASGGRSSAIPIWSNASAPARPGPPTIRRAGIRRGPRAISIIRRWLTPRSNQTRISCVPAKAGTHLRSVSDGAD